MISISQRKVSGFRYKLNTKLKKYLHDDSNTMELEAEIFKHTYGKDKLAGVVIQYSSRKHNRLSESKIGVTTIGNLNHVVDITKTYLVLTVEVMDPTVLFEAVHDAWRIIHNEAYITRDYEEDFEIYLRPKKAEIYIGVKGDG